MNKLNKYLLRTITATEKLNTILFIAIIINNVSLFASG